MVSEWPHANFVQLVTTKSAPKSSGRTSSPVISVLSTLKSAPGVVAWVTCQRGRLLKYAGM